MFQMSIGSILMDNPDAIKYFVVGLVAIFFLTTLIKKLFKLALILALIALAVYYFPHLISALTLP